MGLDSSYEPKLSLFSLPNKLIATPTTSTPPIGALVSVPFQWEEVPGKPRRSRNDAVGPKSKVVRCLDLPPRLLNEANSSSSNSDILSPSTVLDGPYLDHPFRSRSLSSTGSVRPSLFGSGRWKNKDIGVVDFSTCGAEDDDAKVKIIRFARKSSFFGFSSSTSYFFTNIYESFKQVVPWRRRRRNSDK